jgi:ABC-2 type transport system ATP-binding protein
MDDTVKLMECRDLTVAYGPIVALDNLNLEVKGGAVGLLGRNGAGKSTLLRTLLGFVKPRSGSVKLLGHPVADEPLVGRELIGYMPEQSCYVAELKTWAAVAYGGELAGLPRREAVQRAHEILSFVGLAEERYRDVASLSTGMQQRVKLAQALVHGPGLLLLDEPTNGLDPRGRRDMLALIKDIVERMGMHVVLSTHLLHDVETVCSYVTVIEKGRLVVSGTVEELTARELERYEVWVRGDEGAFKEKLKSAGAEAVGRRKDNLIVAVGSDVGTRPILEAAVAAGVELRHLKPVEKSLEEVFLSAIGQD